MKTVQLARVPEIVQGAGAIETLGQTLQGRVPAGSPVLLVADPALKNLGVSDTAQASLTAAGFATLVFSDFKSDPTMAQVDAAAALARREQVMAVVALGGGSAMDVGKTIAAIAGAGEPASHYGLCAHPFPRTRLYSVAVPTTAGTGAEATRTTALLDAAGAKVWLWGDELKPLLIVLDPMLTTRLPAALTAATAIDALVHAIEASTNAYAHAANDLYCHQAIRLIARHLVRAIDTPRDLEARAGLQWAATAAGIGVDNCGTAIAHNIGHALASLRPVHHGRAVGLALKATLAWNVESDVEGRYAAIAVLLGEGPDATRLPAAFDGLLRRAGIKVSLAGEGYDHITPAQLAAQMGRPENEAMRRSNKRPVADADLLRFASSILTAR